MPRYFTSGNLGKEEILSKVTVTTKIRSRARAANNKPLLSGSQMSVIVIQSWPKAINLLTRVSSERFFVSKTDT